MEFVGEEYGPGIGRPPQNRLIVAVPGKDAVPVGFEQSFGSQVAADGEQTFGRCRINRRETQIRRVCAEPEHGSTRYSTRREKATVSSRLRKNSVYTQNADGIFRGRRCQNSRRMLKKARFLTRPTLAATSPSRPESAKTASSPMGAPCPKQGRSERPKVIFPSLLVISLGMGAD